MHTHPYILLRPGDKRPAPSREGRWQYATRDEALAHVRRGGNIGLATGARAGVFVLDIDTKPGGDGRDGYATLDRVQQVYGLLPSTMTVLTPSGGAHFYFRYPDGWKHTTSAGKIGTGIDTRCEGGYVVCPPSRIGDGQYLTIQRGELAMVPEWIMRALDARPVDVVASYQRARRPYAAQDGARFGGIIRSMESAQEGGRNALLNWAAYKMSLEGATDGDLTQLAEAAISAGLDPREIDATIESATRAATQRRA